MTKPKFDKSIKTQKEAARRVGVSTQTIYRWEKRDWITRSAAGEYSLVELKSAAEREAQRIWKPLSIAKLKELSRDTEKARRYLIGAKSRFDCGEITTALRLLDSISKRINSKIPQHSKNDE